MKLMPNDTLTNEHVQEIIEELKLGKGQNTKILNDVIEKPREGNEELVKAEIQYEINPETGLGQPSPISDDINFDLDISLEDLENADTSDLDNMKITKEMIESSEATQGISDDEAIELLSFIEKYQSSPKSNMYNELPSFIKKGVDDMYAKAGGSMSKKEITTIVMDSLIQEIKMDQAFYDLNEAVKNELKMPSMSEMYAEFMKENFEIKIREEAEKIKETNPEKAETLIKISDAYSKTYTYEEMMESLSNRKVRQYIKDPSKYKKMCNNFNRKYENSRFKISDIFMCKRVIMKCIPELEEDYVNKFIMLFCKVCENKNPDNIEDHVFMYYTIQNIRLLEHDKLDEMIEDKRSDMYLTVTENIKKVIEKIKSVETVKGGK